MERNLRLLSLKSNPTQQENQQPTTEEQKNKRPQCLHCEKTAIGYNPPQNNPLSDINVEDIEYLKIINHGSAIETEPRYLVGLDPVDGNGDLHMFTDKSLFQDGFSTTSI